MPKTRRPDSIMCSLRTSEDVKTERIAWAGKRKTVYIRNNPTATLALRIADQAGMTLDDTIGLLWLYTKLEEVRAFATSVEQYPGWLEQARPYLNAVFDPKRIRYDTDGPQKSVVEIYKAMTQLMPMLYVALLNSGVCRDIRKGEFKIEV